MTVELRAEPSTQGLQVDVSCDEKPHRIDLGDDPDLNRVSAVVLSVSSSPETTFYAEIRS